MTGQETTSVVGAGRGALEVVTARLEDAAAAPLLEGLLFEYTSRYGEKAVAEFDRHPTRLFTEEHGGALLLLVEDGRTVAGGALRAYEPELAAAGIAVPGFPEVPTTEFKRIWTHAEHRRRGLGRRVLDALEGRARGFGYRQVFLTTGPNQPEAVALYASAGYTEIVDGGAPDRGIAIHPFIKSLS
jgi:ribosomal protein S18 acetylase RimI-like enzyme